MLAQPVANKPGAALGREDVAWICREHTHGLLWIRTRQPAVLDEAQQQRRTHARRHLAQTRPARTGAWSAQKRLHTAQANCAAANLIFESECEWDQRHLASCSCRHTPQQMRLAVARSRCREQHERIARPTTGLYLTLVNGRGDMAHNVTIHAGH